MQIKAIETQYKGYRFRSRLEARWAVFFDALGTKWDYEPEGFDLGEAGWYLPDFWLPTLELWVEVKPIVTPNAIQKAELFRNNIGAIVLTAGNPSNEIRDTLFCHDLNDSSGGSYTTLGEWNYCGFCQHLFFDVTRVDSRVLRDRSIFPSWDYEIGKWPVDICCNHSGRELGVECTFTNGNGVERSMVDWAIIESRSARFEYGETP